MTVALSLFLAGCVTEGRARLPYTQANVMKAASQCHIETVIAVDDNSITLSGFYLAPDVPPDTDRQVACLIRKLQLPDFFVFDLG